MVENFRTAVSHVLLVEGDKYTNHPADRGGPTKYGITLRTLQEYRKNPNLTFVDVQNLSRKDAVKVYKKLYWDRMRLDGVNDSRACLIMFDSGVHSGTRTAIKLAQKAINDVDSTIALDVDGIMGPKTAAALNHAVCPKRFGLSFFKKSQERYITIAKRDPSQLAFLQGWINRSYLSLEYFL